MRPCLPAQVLGRTNRLDFVLKCKSILLRATLPEQLFTSVKQNLWANKSEFGIMWEKKVCHCLRLFEVLLKDRINKRPLSPTIASELIWTAKKKKKSRLL